MVDGGVPVIYTLMHLAFLTGSPWDRLHECVRRYRDPYAMHEIRKRSGGNRRICVPAPYLKRVQTWIHRSILLSDGARALVHDSSTAYGPGCSSHKNATVHAGASWIVKLDIKDFFESISERQVYHLYRKLGYPALLAFELARLSTRHISPYREGARLFRDGRWRWTAGQPGKAWPYPRVDQVGHLPQGAPTSPMLANLVVREMDEKIKIIARAAGATYTRYADDMVLSLTFGSRAAATALLQSVADVVTGEGFRINRKKTHACGPGARKIVTGLLVNETSPRLPRSLKDEIELALHFIERRGLMAHLEHKKSNNPIGYLNHLKGLILYAQLIEPDFASAAKDELARVLHPYTEFLDVFKTFRPAETNKFKFG